MTGAGKRIGVQQSLSVRLELVGALVQLVRRVQLVQLVQLVQVRALERLTIQRSGRTAVFSPKAAAAAVVRRAARRAGEYYCFSALASSSRAFSQSRRTVRSVTPRACAISRSFMPPK